MNITSERSHHVSTSCDKHRTSESTQHCFQSVIQSTATSCAPEKHWVLAQIAHAFVLSEALNFCVRELFETIIYKHTTPARNSMHVQVEALPVRPPENFLSGNFTNEIKIFCEICAQVLMPTNGPRAHEVQVYIILQHLFVCNLYHYKINISQKFKSLCLLLL